MNVRLGGKEHRSTVAASRCEVESPNWSARRAGWPAQVHWSQSRAFALQRGQVLLTHGPGADSHVEMQPIPHTGLRGSPAGPRGRPRVTDAGSTTPRGWPAGSPATRSAAPTSLVCGPEAAAADRLTLRRAGSR